MNSLLLTIMLLITTMLAESSAQTNKNISKSKFASIFFNGKIITKAQSNALSKATNPNLPVSTKLLNWGSTSWDSVSNSLFVYDNNERVGETTIQRFQSGAFTTVERMLHKYDTAGREIENINQQFVAGNWVNYRRDTLAYSAEGIETLSLNQNWENNAWVTNFGFRALLTYNSGGLLQEMIQQMLDSNSNWENTTKVTFTNNANGQIDGGTAYQFDSTGNWTPLARFINAIFLDNNFERPISYTLQVPAPVIGWVDFQRYTSYYNTTSKLLDSSLTESYDFIARNWSNASKDIFTYDSKGNQVLMITHIWEPNGWKMESGQKDSITYNTDGNIATQVTQYWNDFNPFWENSEMKIHTYPTITFIAENSVFGAHKIYPNPAREMLKVEALGVKAERVKISVTDLTGRQVYTDNINTNSGMLNTTINTSGLKSGIYILQIQAGNQVVNQKIVKD